MGDASLKDLTRPERVYQLNQPDLPSEFPPLKTLNSGELPNNLPQQPTSFIGREKEIADIKALLLKSRLLTLVGPGGAGKTRLALQTSADLLDGEGDGVWLVESAALSDSGLVPAAVAHALGVKEQGGEAIAKTLMAALRTTPLLIILDNCEHVLDACCSLATDLLRSCVGVHILATSREPLGAPGEQVYRVPSLSVPSGNSSAAATVESLSHYESVHLFIERAKAVQPSFSVTDANAPTVDQLCAHLDGIPLAIELAAAQVRSMAVEQLNARLDHRFNLLTGGSHMSLPRQQTLKALIDWSYDLLTVKEKTMLQRSSVFAGVWTLEAAETVCSDEEANVRDWEAVDLLTSLTDKSLVVYQDSDDSSHYRLLESIRQYGKDKLNNSGESDKVARRHRKYWSTIAVTPESELRGQNQAAWLKSLDEGYDNVQSAIARSDQHQESWGDLAEHYKLIVYISRYRLMRGHFTEARQQLSRVLDALRTLEQAEKASLRTLQMAGLNFAGYMANMQGDYDSAVALLSEGLANARDHTDETFTASFLYTLGLTRCEQNKPADAVALLTESLARRRSSAANDWVIASSLMGLGSALRLNKDYTAAREALQESLALMIQPNENHGISNALGSLGDLARDEQDYGSSREFYEKSLKIRTRINDPTFVAGSLWGLAVIAFAESAATLLAIVELS